ncbi:hypothetical protein [Flavisolibacter ginsengisoli]|uniref:hypothetical protein n=1 Tax=Flavisolibacter ginsengisoli TaxID=462367 RepID=UPI0009354F47|nr:hypothetical protein [Flavisolibacter ginsengisoli]
MKKVLKSRYLLLAFLFIFIISAFSFIAYSRSHSVSTEIEKCCQKPESNSNEMLWDILSRQMVSAVHM